jgi:hypothetical protein
MLDPEDVNSPPSASPQAPANTSESDPNDDVPVPVAMSAAEVDERAQVVEQLRRNQAAETNDQRLDA